MRPPRAPLTAAAVVLALALGGCTGDDAAPPLAASPTPTPIAAYDSSDVAIARADFCSLLPDEAVDAALGGREPTATSYGEGDTVQVVPGVRERSGELGCTYRAADGTEARTWVFAPPVTVERAHRVARSTSAAAGCRVVRDAAPFGSPSVATLCRGATTLSATYAGLFVDAWLGCSVTVPRAGASWEALRQRAGDWCVATASAGSLAPTGG